MTTPLKPIKIGSIIHLKNQAEDGGYLDTRGWVTDKSDFWNVSGTERAFVSTHAKAERDGSSGSWQIVSATGKSNDETLRVGDCIHLLNMYPDVGFLDCCGWVEHLIPYRTVSNLARNFEGSVRCGVFTSASRDRDNGTGKWIVKADNKNDGDAINENDVIRLVNGYVAPASQEPAFRETGSLVTYKNVMNQPVFSDYAGQLKLVFTSTNATVRDSPAGQWQITLPKSTQAKTDDTSNRLLFDFFRPELLKGRSDNMKGIAQVTDIVLSDVFNTVSSKSLNNVSKIINEYFKAIEEGESADNLARFFAPDAKLLDHVDDSDEHDTASEKVTDHKFQIQQLLNLLAFSRILKKYDEDVLFKYLEASATKHAADGTLQPLHLYRQCFQHIATDHEVIQRATIQRRWNEHNNTFVQSRQAYQLMIMDKLAIKAIKPFKHLLPDYDNESLAILTYFDKTTHIHHVPYTRQFVLVGVSYDRIPPNSPTQESSLNDASFSAFELMAIPHEVGHFIYRNGQLNDGRKFSDISQKFRKNAYYKWCEEIFADVYGCIIAGPLSVYSMQAFLTSGDKERAWKDDDEHPTPIFRSYILAEILRALDEKERMSKSYKSETVPTTLDEDWAEILESWGYDRIGTGKGRPERFYLPFESGTYLDKIVNVNRIIKEVEPIIKEYVKLLLDSYDNNQPTNEDASGDTSMTVPWSQEEAEGRVKYAEKMALLTGRDTATATVTQKIILETNTYTDPAITAEEDPDNKLEKCLAGWERSGPSGTGGGTYGRGYAS